MNDVQIETEIRQRTGIQSPLRTKQLVQELVKRLNLDLSGFVVLTEAASANYLYTPLIAAMANAKKVIAVTKDSKYGKAKDIMENTLLLTKYFGIEEKTIQICEILESGNIGEVDIVTNLGFVRPINKEFISHLKKTAVIPLMYETWELRKEDMDLRECWKREIPVLGTNEKHGTLKIFDYIGHLCLKILLDAGIEVFGSKVALIGNNKFNTSIVKTLSKLGADILCITNTTQREMRRLEETEIAPSLKETVASNKIKHCDAIIINTYPSRDVAIGETGELSAEKLKTLAPGAIVIQFNGQVDRKSLHKFGIVCLPKDKPKIGHMGWTLANLGPKPLIALHSGGLKVGELLARARLRSSSHTEAEREALKDSICQDFSPEQRDDYG